MDNRTLCGFKLLYCSTVQLKQDLMWLKPGHRNALTVFIRNKEDVNPYRGVFFVERAHILFYVICAVLFYGRYNDLVCNYKVSLAYVSYLLLGCCLHTGFDNG
jgi:hypothetical protein